MSDVEEPPQKVTKMEGELSVSMEEDGEDMEMLDEGQEEWLSEEVYTDEEFAVPAGSTIDQNDQDSTVNSSQDALSLTESKPDVSQENNQTENIEETLNNLDGSKELPDLDAFLIRKTDGKVVETKVPDAKPKEEADGNDTDDLLRMLGEEETKAKKKLLKVKDRKPEVDHNNSSDDDDDSFLYEGAKVTRLKVAKNALLHKYTATKAVPEDTSDGDESEQSTDEAVTVQKMFSTKRANVAAKSTSKPAHKQTDKSVKLNKHKDKPSQNQTKSILKPIAPKADTPKKPPVTFKTNLRPELASKLATATKVATKLSTPAKIVTLTRSEMEAKILSAKYASKNTSKIGNTSRIENTSRVGNTSRIENTSRVGNTSRIGNTSKNASASKIVSEYNDIDFDDVSNMDEEEFLDEDGFDLNEEEFCEDSDMELGSKQRLQRPERMDEEVPSDGDSHSEDGSLYDELPSSESDELEDWFTIDIRAERAGDYLPLLGSKAYEILSAEKRRVTERLSTLRESLGSLTDSGRQQADDLRRATMTLAELDDMLKAT